MTIFKEERLGFKPHVYFHQGVNVHLLCQDKELTRDGITFLMFIIEQYKFDESFCPDLDKIKTSLRFEDIRFVKTINEVAKAGYLFFIDNRAWVSVPPLFREREHGLLGHGNWGDNIMHTTVAHVDERYPQNKLMIDDPIEGILRDHQIYYTLNQLNELITIMSSNASIPLISIKRGCELAVQAHMREADFVIRAVRQAHKKEVDYALTEPGSTEKGAIHPLVMKQLRNTFAYSDKDFEIAKGMFVLLRRACQSTSTTSILATLEDAVSRGCDETALEDALMTDDWANSEEKWPGRLVRIAVQTMESDLEPEDPNQYYWCDEVDGIKNHVFVLSPREIPDGFRIRDLREKMGYERTDFTVPINQIKFGKKLAKLVMETGELLDGLEEAKVRLKNSK